MKFLDGSAYALEQLSLFPTFRISLYFLSITYLCKMYLFKEFLELAGRGSSAADVIPVMSEASTEFRSAAPTAKKKG